MPLSRYDWFAIISVLFIWFVALRLGAAPALLAGLASFAGCRAMLASRSWGQMGRGMIALSLALLPIFALWAVSAFLGSHFASLSEELQAMWQRLLAQLFELKSRWPNELGLILPEQPEQLQKRLLQLLSSRGEQLFAAGKHGLGQIFLALVGWWLGLAAAMAIPGTQAGPFLLAWRTRWLGLGLVFGRLARGQFWIALINTLFTAIFLFVIAPLADWHFPFRMTLLLVTFLLSLIPVAGNLLCNTLLLLLGLGVSLAAGLAALVFLIVVHKAEYLVSARVLGSANQLAAWELISAMLAGELLFGPVGLVCAAILYPYIKHELRAAGLI